MSKLLTASQIEAYHRDGFLSPIDIFSEDEAAELRAELEAAEARWPDALVGAGRNNAHLNLTCLDRIVHHSRLVDAVEDIIGPNILNYGTVLFIKEAGDPGFVSWHQDGRYMGLTPLEGLTAWVALSPSNAESGCMQMIPGSHGHLRPHHDTFGAENILTRGQQIKDVDETTAVSLVLKPGQVSFHNMEVMHASQPNHSVDRRIGFVIQCYIPPHMRQTLAPVGAQWVRGEDPYRHFEYLSRPASDMDADDLAARDRTNAAWSDILYHGAERRRDF